MNLEEEFKRIGSTAEDIKPVIYDLYRQREEMEKKIHLLNVVSFTRGVMEILNSIDIRSYNVSALNFNYYRDHGTAGNNIMFDLLDLKGQVIDADIVDEKQDDLWGQVMDLLTSNALNHFDNRLINQEFKEDVWSRISLLSNTEEKILDLFLNKELKNGYEYYKMNSDLPNSNVSGKKSKI
jgi:hypothetical protein